MSAFAGRGRDLPRNVLTVAPQHVTSPGDRVTSAGNGVASVVTGWAESLPSGAAPVQGKAGTVGSKP